MRRKYIFVLCPPYQGSTLIVNLLNSSKNVSTLLDCNTWAGEAQWLYKRHGDKKYFDNRWNPNYELNMKLVENILNRYLDSSKSIWVEKSPSHICRAKKFQEYFSKLGDVYFIVSIRNPYSWNGREYKNKWLTFAEYQKYNIENLDNVIQISYEECCNNLGEVIKKITEKIPELGKIYNNRHRLRRSERCQFIHKKKVNRIIDKKLKNADLKKNVELVHYFGYNIIE